MYGGDNMRQLNFFVKGTHAIFQSLWKYPIFFNRPCMFSDATVQQARTYIDKLYGDTDDWSSVSYPEYSDEEALRRDWEKLGDDMRNAIDEYATQSR